MQLGRLGAAVRLRGLVAVLCVVTLCAACGSTVPLGTPGASGDVAAGSGSGLGIPDGMTAGDAMPPGLAQDAGEHGSDDAAAPDLSTAAGSPSGAGAPVAGGPPAARGGPAAGGSGTAAAPRNTGPIEVGIQILANGNSGLSALGLDVEYGDSRVQAEALVRDINGRGGLAGRKIKPVYYVQDVADMQTTPDQKMEQACAKWTQDHHVEVAASPFSVTEVLLKCLAERDVPFALAPGGGFDDVHFRTYGPYLSAPIEPSLTRWAHAQVRRLVAQDFFGKAAKIGVIHIDDAHSHRTRAVLHQELTRHGMGVAEYHAFSRDQDEAVAQLQGAVLAFKGAGVTHVLPILPGGGGVIAFMVTAEQQQYRPRYGLSSHDAPGALLQSNVPSSQLRGSRGMGWNPSFDVDDGNDPGLTSSGKRCKALMERAGQNLSSRVARWSAFAFCDVMWELEGAFAGATATDPDTFLAGLHRLGTTFTPAATFRSRFGPNRADGAAAVRDLYFDDSCNCFRYDGPLRGL